MSHNALPLPLLSLIAWQPNIKHLQIQLTGFLDKSTPAFCKELWGLCISAQDSPLGVPKELLEAKKQELKQEKVSSRLSTFCSIS
jgi:serine/arginine repetitive matrix protein 1